MTNRSRGVERLDPAKAGMADRTWTGNDASARNHNGVVRLSESPVSVALSWRSEKGGQARFVGFFELDLARLLANDLVRIERAGEIRLRFFHDHDGKVYLQRKLDTPRFMLGRV